MAAQIFPFGTALTVVWHLTKPDGTDFDITGYTYRAYYRTGNKETEFNGTRIAASGNTISMSLPANEQQAPGEYALRLVLFQNGNLFCTMIYNNAFVLSRRMAETLQTQTQQNEMETVHLFTVAQFYLLSPIIPTVGTDGYWYVDGTRVTDGDGQPVPSSHTMEFDPETYYIVIDKGRVDKDGNSIEQYITVLGNGISDIEQYIETTVSSGMNVMRITFDDGRVRTFNVYNGARGERGFQGLPGATGAQGLPGATGATGPKGDKGDKGDSGVSLGDVVLTTDLDETETGKALDASAMQTIPHFVDEEQEIEDVPSNYYTKPQVDAKIAAHTTSVNNALTAQDDQLRNMQTLVNDVEEVVSDFIHNTPVVINQGTINNAADEEDLTSEDNVLKFKDRMPVGGMGYIILRKDKTFAEQLTKTNTIYEIRYNFDLLASSVTMPANCVLYFTGGSLTNGRIVGDNTKVYAPNYEIFKHGTIKYRGYLSSGNYGFVSDYGTSIRLAGTWNNSRVGSAWTGLDYFNGNSTESAELALQNYIILHAGDVKFVKAGVYYYYGSKLDLRERNVDFAGSTINTINYPYVLDTSLALPSGATEYKVNNVATLRRVGDIIWFDGAYVTLQNLTINDRATERGEKCQELGEVMAIRITANGHDLFIKNVRLLDILDCGFALAETNYNITWDHVDFDKVGEHGVYTHAYHGSLRFLYCNFKDCSLSYEVDQLRSGRSACIRNRIEGITSGDLVVECDHCTFTATPSLYGGSGQPRGVLTMMDTPYRAYFRNCSWEGPGLSCSVYMTDTLLSAFGDLPEYIFEGCTNVRGLYQSASSSVNNVRVRYRSCENVENPIWYAVEISNCKCVINYLSVPQNYNTTMFPNELNQNLVVSDSEFVLNSGGASGYNRITSNMRGAEFSNCKFTAITAQHDYIFTFTCGNREFSFKNCLFNHGNQRLMELTADNGTSQSVKFYGCNFDRAYGNYLKVPAGTFIEVIGCNLSDVESGTKLCNTLAGFYPRHTAGNYDKYSWFYSTQVYSNAKDGSVLTFPYSKNMGFADTDNISSYITVEPIDCFEAFTYTVTNNGTDNNSSVTLSGPQTGGKFRVTLDLRSKE